VVDSYNILKRDSTGDPVWAKNVATASAGLDLVPYGLTLSPDENSVIGLIRCDDFADVTFDPGGPSEFTFTNVSTDDTVFIFSYATSDGSLNWVKMCRTYDGASGGAGTGYTVHPSRSLSVNKVSNTVRMGIYLGLGGGVRRFEAGTLEPATPGDLVFVNDTGAGDDNYPFVDVVFDIDTGVAQSIERVASTPTGFISWEFDLVAG